MRDNQIPIEGKTICPKCGTAYGNPLICPECGEVRRAARKLFPRQNMALTEPPEDKMMRPRAAETK